MIALGAQPVYQGLHQRNRLIRGIIQNLDIEQLAGIIQANRSTDQALNHIHFIVDR